MYREPANPPAADAPPRELVYGAKASGGESSAVAMFQLFTVPLVVCIAFSVMTTPTIGLGALVASGIGSWWWRKRRPTREGAVLRIEEGELRVYLGGGGQPRARFGLTELDDVGLDIKKIQRVQEGGSAIPAVRFIDSTVGPELDTARIVLIGDDGQRVPLSDAYLAYMDATEWMGKIRVWLRKHGWVPHDEIESPESDDG